MDNEKRNKNRSGKSPHQKNSFNKMNETRKGYLPEIKEVIKNDDEFSLKYLNTSTRNITKQKPNTHPQRQVSSHHDGTVKNTPEHKANFRREKKPYVAGFEDSFFETGPVQQTENKKKPHTKLNSSHRGHTKHTGQTKEPGFEQFFTGVGKKQSEDKIPPLKDGDVRVIALGGVEEIGKNMYVVEYKNDIIILDAGFQFTDNNITPGVDYIIPNIGYLEKRKDKIRALIITHGHLDHTGAIPYIMGKIGNPPIYSRLLTTMMIRKRQSEFPDEKELNINIIEKNDAIKLGNLYVKFFSVTHTIPDSMGVIIETPHGSIVNPGDFKLDHIDGIATEEEEERYKIFNTEKVLLLMADSTNVENPGFSTPEKFVHRDLEKIIKDINGRLVIGTFASQIERIIKIIAIAEKYGKKVVIEGRSMKDNIAIVKEIGLLKTKPDTIINLDQSSKIPEDKIVVLATGAQGDEYAALMRMSTGEHKLKLHKNDTVVLSSSIIPGNEIAVQKLKDNLARQRVKIVHYRTSDLFIHSTGHGNHDEIEWLHKKVKPKFFIPIHGWHSMLRLHAELAESTGMREDHIIVPDNGMVIEIKDNGNKIVALKEKATSSMMMVDGFSIGDIQDVVIRDRQLLAEDGIFIIVATINARTGKLRKSPDIISRGFVYLRESQELLQQTRLIIKKVVEESTVNMYPINFDYIKTNITDSVRKFLLQQTAKKPLVIPVVLAI